jgi:hypothetical protein
MEQEIRPTSRTWFSSISICRVADGLYPAVLNFFKEQTTLMNMPGGIKWALRYPNAQHTMFAAISGERLVGLVFWEEADNSVVLILDRIYFGGGTFLRLLQAMDEHLKGKHEGYVLRMPDLQAYHSLALAGGCHSLQGCGGALSAQRKIEIQIRKILSY